MRFLTRGKYIWSGGVFQQFLKYSECLVGNSFDCKILSLRFWKNFEVSCSKIEISSLRLKLFRNVRHHKASNVFSPSFLFLTRSAVLLESFPSILASKRILLNEQTNKPKKKKRKKRSLFEIYSWVICSLPWFTGRSLSYTCYIFIYCSP